MKILTLIEVYNVYEIQAGIINGYGAFGIRKSADMEQSYY